MTLPQTVNLISEFTSRSDGGRRIDRGRRFALSPIRPREGSTWWVYNGTERRGGHAADVMYSSLAPREPQPWRGGHLDVLMKVSQYLNRRWRARVHHGLCDNRGVRNATLRAFTTILQNGFFRWGGPLPRKWDEAITVALYLRCWWGASCNWLRWRRRHYRRLAVILRDSWPARTFLECKMERL